MDENQYSTRSLGEAAYLHLNGLQLLSAIDNRHCDCFSFDNKDNCARRLAAQFYEDATAPARPLSIAMGELRREASQARRQQ